MNTSRPISFCRKVKKRWLVFGALLMASCGFGQTVDYNIQVQNPPGYLSDAQRQPFATFYAACSAAVSAGKVLAVTKAWTGVATGTCSSSVEFLGGSVRPSSGSVVTFALGTSIIAGEKQQIFDYSQGGTVAFVQAPTSGPANWWGAKGNCPSTGVSCTDDFAAIQAAVNSQCGAVYPGAVLITSGIYRVTGTISWATNACAIGGLDAFTTELRHDPASANTDLISFPGTVSYNTWNSVRGIRLTTASATNTRYLLSVANNSKFTLDACRFSNSGAGRPLQMIHMTGMLGSLLQNFEVVGPAQGTNSLVFVGTSGLGVSTTTNISYATIISSGGAGLETVGSAGAATINISDSILEANVYGAKAATQTSYLNTHFEGNTTSDVLTTAVASLTFIGNSFQHATSTPMVDLTGGGVVKWACNETDLASGKTLFNAVTGTHVYTSCGPLLPFGVFPSGVINSGNPLAIAAPALPMVTFPFPGVSGDITTQGFRGSTWDVGVAGATVIHIGESNLGYPTGEEWTFILRTNGSAVTFSSANTNDYPISGTINNTGIAAGTFQVVVLKLDSNGHFVVKSSPGWQTY